MGLRQLDLAHGPLAPLLGCGRAGGAAASAGPNYPGSAASSASGEAEPSTVAVETPENASAADSSYAIVRIEGGGTAVGEVLRVSDFGFELPGGATVAGITVEVGRKLTNGDGNTNQRATDLLAKLDKGGMGGGLVGDNKARNEFFADSDEVATYGGAADLWGATWTPAEVNDAAFGVAYQWNVLSSGDNTALVDFVRVTVHYTA